MDGCLKEATTSGGSGGSAGSPDVVQITFPKGPSGGIGLSIVCAQVRVQSFTQPSLATQRTRSEGVFWMGLEDEA